MEPGETPVQDDKAASGNLCRTTEIQQAQRLANGLMIHRFKIELLRLTDAANLGIGRIISAIRNILMQQVRHVVQHCFECHGNLIEAPLSRVQCLTKLTDLTLQGLNVFPCRLGLADGFGSFISTPALCLDLNLKRLALSIKGRKSITIEDESPACQIARDAIDILAQKF